MPTVECHCTAFSKNVMVESLSTMQLHVLKTESMEIQMNSNCGIIPGLSKTTNHKRKTSVYIPRRVALFFRGNSDSHVCVPTNIFV